MKTDLIYEQDTYRILGACFDVYNEKGCGFLEAVYQECLEIELGLRGIPFVAQQPIQISYKRQPLQQLFKGGLVCYGRILVELKAVSTLVDEHRAQVLNYLNATSLPLGLLLNFGHYPKLEYERIVLTQRRPRRTQETRNGPQITQIARIPER
jgi:GxxExxY protein